MGKEREREKERLPDKPNWRRRRSRRKIGHGLSEQIFHSTQTPVSHRSSEKTLFRAGAEEEEEEKIINSRSQYCLAASTLPLLGWQNVWRKPLAFRGISCIWNESLGKRDRPPSLFPPPPRPFSHPPLKTNGALAGKKRSRRGENDKDQSRRGGFRF